MVVKMLQNFNRHKFLTQWSATTSAQLFLISCLIQGSQLLKVLLIEALYSLFITLQVFLQLLGYVLIIFPFNLISQALGVFIVYIKDFLKLLFVFYITIIISLYHSSLYIMALYSINICLARDLFSSLEADLGYIEGFVYSDMVREVYYNCPSIGN